MSQPTMIVESLSEGLGLAQTRQDTPSVARRQERRTQGEPEINSLLARVPLLALRRPAWQPVAGDRWREVADAKAAADALGEVPRRVFLALGRNEIAPFAGAPQHVYLVRSVDAVEPPLAVPHAAYIRARGPFREEDDRALLAGHEIDVVVAKNSGGPAAYGKIAAARALGIEVMLLRRPSLPVVPSVETIADAVAWLDHAPASVAERGV